MYLALGLGANHRQDRGRIRAAVDAARLLQCMTMAYFAGQLSMIPMGLGAKDASLVALLGKSGVPAHTAIAFAAVDRVATTGLTLVIGAVCAGILGLKRGRQVESS